jgi:hypothetical protein
MVSSVKKGDETYATALGIALAIGVGLRLYLLRDQILIDDEWHGLLFIYGKSFFQVVTQVNLQEHSSPLLNIWRFLCYQTTGVSEWNLRLPLFVAGSALVTVFPLLVRRIVPDRAGIIFSFLLALSPFLIFYSRFSRSYVIVAFLSFFSLLQAFRWVATNKSSHAAGFVAASAIAVYAHPSAVAAALAVYLTLAAALGWRRFFRDSAIAGQIQVSPGTVLKVMAVHGVCLVLAAWNFISNAGRLRTSAESITGSEMLNMLHLLCGSASTPVVIAFCSAALFGCWRLYRITPLLALLLGLAAVSNIAFLLFTHPLGLETSAIFLRYSIVIIPVILLWVALGASELLDQLQKKLAKPFIRQIAPGLCLAAGIFIVYIEGPLPTIYRAPNNFTSHLAYQGSYEYGDWQKSKSNHYLHSYQISRDEIPAFYKWLATDSNSQAIIEYPFDFSDHSDLDYFYQIYHRKRVFAGFCGDRNRIALSVSPEMHERMQAEKLTLGVARPEFFLPGDTYKTKTHFRNMIDVADDWSLRESGAGYIVLHKSIESVYFGPGRFGNFPLYDASVNYFAAHFKEIFGRPVFEDGRVIVFPIQAL